MDTLKFVSAATDAMNARVCALSRTPNSMATSSGGSEPGDQATSGGSDCGGGGLKGLVGLLYQGRAILPEPAHRRPGRRFVYLYKHAAALVERKFDETLHYASSPEHSGKSAVLLHPGLSSRGRKALL